MRGGLRHLLGLTLFAMLAAAWAADPVPDTLEEAFVLLDRSLSSTDRASFMAAPEQEAVAREHFGLGLYIRNLWFRAGGSRIPAMLQAQHLDDASAIVLTSYWRHLNGRPLKVQAQVACYRRWWQAQHRLIQAANDRKASSYDSPSFSCP